jgi:hypothetical protein
MTELVKPIFEASRFTLVIVGALWLTETIWPDGMTLRPLGVLAGFVFVLTYEIGTRYLANRK